MTSLHAGLANIVRAPRHGLGKICPGLSPCLESSLPFPLGNYLSIYLQLSVCLPLPHFHPHCLLHFPSSSHLFFRQSVTVTSIVLSAPQLTLCGETWNGVTHSCVCAHTCTCTHICDSQEGGVEQARVQIHRCPSNCKSCIVGVDEQIRWESLTHTRAHIIVCQAVSDRV